MRSHAIVTLVVSILVTVLGAERAVGAGFGSCCYADGTCSNVASEAFCESLGGIYFVQGANCSQAPCDDIGACCLDFGCEIVGGPAECDGIGGTWMGAGTVCEQFTCAGACCLPNGGCFLSNLISCGVQGGTWQGLGTTCATETCLGACCLVGSCDLTSLDACGASGGTWQGYGTTCADTCLGACCFPNGSCALRTQNECVTAGTWQGSNIDCVDVECLDTTGACCVLGICSEVDSASECASTGGTFIPMISCAGAPCFGACCLPGGDCQFLDAGSCEAQGGSYFPSEGCEELVDTCGGVCCFVDGTCDDTFSVDCLVMGGTFTPDASCASTTCPDLLGACCYPDGTCDLVLESECLIIYWQGAGSDCTTANCPIFGGACCTGSACEQLDEFGCDFIGGVYLDGVSCADPTACTVACCLGDDGCVELTSGQCFALGGCNYGLGTPCADITCPTYSVTRTSTEAAQIDGAFGSTAETSIYVGLTGQVVDVDVSFTILHTYVGDLCIELTHDGVTVLLVERAGGVVECGNASPANCSADNYFVSLDDGGTGGPLEDQCVDDLTSPPSYTPHDSLAGFRGTDVNGEWRLTVTDWSNSDGGVLSGWSIRVTTCTPLCSADVDGDGAVAFGDLLAVLAAWGPCLACPEDVDADGGVGFSDLLAVLAAWGPC